MDPTEIQRAVSYIYSECDPTGSDSVPVSNLLQMIRPHFKENMTQLEELQKKLDPNNSNPCISSTSFFEAMNQWASQIINNDTFEVTQEFVQEERLAHSTPRPKDSYYNFVKSCSEIFNVSAASTGDEREILEERVKQLHYEICMTTNELAEVKKQLSQSSESNEILNMQLKEMTAHVTASRKTNDELHQCRLDHQKMKEELNWTKSKCERTQTQLDENVKKYKMARQEQEKLENMKAILEDQLENLSNKDNDSMQIIIDLETQLEQKNVEISNLKVSVDKLTKQLDENNATIEYFEQLLGTHKASLEKCLCKHLSEKARVSSHLSDVNEKRYAELNSPSLVKKAVIGSETNKPAGNNDMLKLCLQKKVQYKTGEEQLMMPKKHILDESLPVIFKNLPVLSPARETSPDSLSLSDHIQATSPVEDQRSCCPTPRRAPKSLKDEMSEVKSAEETPAVSEVQDEIERLKSRIKELEDSNKTNEVAKEDEDKNDEIDGEDIVEIKEEININIARVERIWANMNESVSKIKEFAAKLNHSLLSSDFIDHQLAVIDSTNSTKETLKKLIRSFPDYEESITSTREHYQEWFDDRLREYTEYSHSLKAFSFTLSAPIMREFSSHLLGAAKLMGMRENESISLKYFKTVLDHVAALEDYHEKVVTPSEGSQIVLEETVMDNAPLAAEETFSDGRIVHGNSEHVEEQTEIYNTPLNAEELSVRAEPARNRCRRSYLKILLPLFMVIIVSIFYFQFVQWNCARVARRVICPFDWLMTRTISGQLF